MSFSCSQTARVLEAESGYTFESDLVASFRETVLEGRWDAVESLLEDVGVQGQEDSQVSKRMNPGLSKEAPMLISP